MVEAFTALRAIDFGFHMGFANVVFEGDSLMVISRLNAMEEDLSALDVFIFYIKAKSLLFSTCQFCHVQRQGNEAANALARYGVVYVNETIWVENCPCLTLDIVLAESIST
ncbi:hypothetical protein PTKIN_Ptkin06aG0132000 [Pterospermum kingtungense]